MGIMLVSGVAVLILIFVGMVFFLQKFFNREVVSATTHLDTIMSETAAKEEEVKKQFEDAKRQSLEIIANAQKDGQQQKEAIIKSAEEEKHKIVSDAQSKADEVVKQADNARLALLSDIEQKVNERAAVKAVHLLQSVLPDDFRKEVHQRWVEGVIANSFESLDRLRIPAGTTQVSVVSAFALGDAQRSALKKKLREKLGFDTTMAETIDPSIIAGIVVEIGSLVLDGSLRFKFQEEARA